MEKVYPSWRYHKTKEAKIIRSDAEDKALGKDWADTPAKFQDEPQAQGGAKPSAGEKGKGA